MILFALIQIVYFTKDGLRYSVHDNEAYLEGFSNEPIENFVIPSQVQSENGAYNVVKIVSNAFKNKEEIKTVKIGNNIKIIGKFSFFEDFGLTSVKFEDNSKLEIIENNCFDRNDNLSEFIIPVSVRKIGVYCFARNALSTWHISASLVEIGVGSFSYMKKANEIIVDSENPNYCSFEGALYSKDKKILHAIPCKEHIHIIDTVEIIEESALVNIVTKSVQLPYCLKTMKPYYIGIINQITYCGPKVFEGQLITGPSKITSAKFVKYDRNFGLAVEKSLEVCFLNADILPGGASHRRGGRGVPCIVAAFFLFN